MPQLASRRPFPTFSHNRYRRRWHWRFRYHNLDRASNYELGLAEAINLLNHELRVASRVVAATFAHLRDQPLQTQPYPAQNSSIRTWRQFAQTPYVPKAPVQMPGRTRMSS